MKNCYTYCLTILCVGLISYQMTAGGAADVSHIQTVTARKLAEQYRDKQMGVDNFKRVPTVMKGLVIHYYRLLTGQDATLIIDMILENEKKPKNEEHRENVKQRVYRFSIQELIDNRRLPAIQDRHLNLRSKYLGSLDGLEHIPGIINVQWLLLSNNQLTKLQPGTFNGLENLRELHLDDNQLTHLQRGAFKGLGSLRRLKLEYNQLTKLQPGIFKGLENLQWLLLYNNKLTELLPGIFNGLENLQVLWFFNNKLTHLQLGIFNGLENLRDLSLSDNQLTQIQPGTFDGLENLRELNLGSNKLTKETKQQIRQEVPEKVGVLF